MKGSKLQDRFLWHDGSITVKFDNVVTFLDHIKHLYVDEMTPEIVQYNKFSPGTDQITVKRSMVPLNTSWRIPEPYLNMDMLSWITNTLHKLRTIDRMSTEDFDIRLERVMMEFKEFKRLNMLEILRSLIYIINTFEQHDVVWGPGRGSSVSSYMLYLIGVHDVDSVEYDLDISDFIKDIQQ